MKRKNAEALEFIMKKTTSSAMRLKEAEPTCQVGQNKDSVLQELGKKARNIDSG